MPLVLACLLAVVLTGTGLRAVLGRGLGLTRYRSAHGRWSRLAGALLLAGGLGLAMLLALDRGLALWLWSGQ